ncbi:MAG: methyltransferase domain-containing protein [Myxococcales bacterium]|nr:methyltransferase domain-containing protein [Myxococcales bacterium]
MLCLRRSLLVPLVVLGCSRASTPPEPAPPSAEAREDALHEAQHGPHAHDGHEAGAAHGPNARHDGHAHHRHHRFEDAEQWAKQFDDPSRDAWQRPEAVIDFIAPAADARIADLGAGTGYFAVRLARRVPKGRVLANDIEPDMVRYLEQRAQREGLSNLVAVQGFPHDPALPEDVDIAFMCDVYHHLEDPKGYFRAVVSRLRPGGRVVIVDFEKDAPADVPGPPPAMRVAREDLVATLAEVGLEPSRVDHELLPHQYVVELRPVAR